jgi:hypothetical protein
VKAFFKTKPAISNPIASPQVKGCENIGHKESISSR